MPDPDAGRCHHPGLEHEGNPSANWCLSTTSRPNRGRSRRSASASSKTSTMRAISVRAPGEGGAACDVVVEPTACEPYGLKTTFYNATGGFVDYDGFSLTVWGVPANPVHNALRFLPNEGSGVSLSPSGVLTRLSKRRTSRTRRSVVRNRSKPSCTSPPGKNANRVLPRTRRRRRCRSVRPWAATACRWRRC